MKSIFLLLFSFLIIIPLNAELSVKSFRKLDNDMTARIDAPKKDQNGDVCAIIKVVTTQEGFQWEPDGLGIVASKRNGGEYWLYVPYGAKRLTINHPLLGILRDYMYPLPIEKACVYEMVLISGRIETTVVEEINTQWLMINPTPSDAMVYLDDQFVKSGVYQAKLKPGSYSYRIEAPLYHTEAGKVQISDKKEVLNVALKPAFGYLQIESKPESGAKIMIDGKLTPLITPARTEALPSGEHTVQVVKEMYQPKALKINVADEQTTPVNLTMQPNFAEVNITAPANTTILINGERKATTSWSGRLNAGVYSLEAQLASHRPAKQDIEIAAGDVKSVDLHPIPIYGSIDITSTPVEATISIDGKDYGTTPNTINKLLIGDYTVQLNKPGYASVSRTISISEGKSSELNETLSNGSSVSITSDPMGAILFIDNTYVGSTPYSGSLTYGKHTLRIEQDGKRAEKSVTIAQSGGETSFNLTFGPKIITETVKGVRFDMVGIKGGTFTMGSPTSEVNRGTNETQHSVTLSSFYMGATEVTQALWQSVMGNNPSAFKGDNLPVEQVSWDDCQTFLRKLNQLTGKTYRLPTEAEWEYACRAGTTTPFNKGNNLTTDQANYDGNYPYNGNRKGVSRKETTLVGSFAPNTWGLYDMHGNVEEWCSDWYGEYISTDQLNSTNLVIGWYRAIRGGGWGSNAEYCRSGSRAFDDESSKFRFRGFRLVLVQLFSDLCTK